MRTKLRCLLALSASLLVPTVRVASVALPVAAIVSVGCRGLAPSGVYQGDAVLHNSELAIASSYDVIHAFLKFEQENRAALAAVPEIKRSADAIRLNAKQWFASAHALHDAYKLSPTTANKTALESSLAVLRAALAEATAHMTTVAQPKGTP